MLYETLDDIPRDCEVPYERVPENEVPQDPSLERYDPFFNLSELNQKDLLDWD